MVEAADQMPPETGVKADHSKRLAGSLFALGIVIVLATAGYAFVHAIGGYAPSPKLSISRVTLFDESHSEGPVGDRSPTSLRDRGNHYFELRNAEDFLLVIGFLISGYAKDENGNPDLNIMLTGTPLSADVKAWDTNKELTSQAAWSNMLVPTYVTPAAIMREFAVQDSTKIPFVTAVQCAEPRELANWSGEIQIKVEDRVAHNVATTTTKLDLKKDISLRSAKKCQE